MNEYKIKTYTNNAVKQKEYWDTAIGLQDVDGLKPSEYLHELSEQNVNGILPIQTVKEKLNEYYKDASKSEGAKTMECDIGEGNTRTTAVFMELYLNSRGFCVNNEMFQEHAKYYRDAMVRANYADYAKGVDTEFGFLERFYENLLFHGKYILKNDDTILA